MKAGSRVAAACTLLGAALIALTVLAAPVTAAGKSVTVTYDLFSPSTVTIRVGDTITWTNLDPVKADHNVTSPYFKSGTLSPGESYKHTFAAAGTFGYRCTIHGNTAKVVVAAPNTPQPTRRATPKPTRAPTPRPTPSPSPTQNPSASSIPIASASPSEIALASATQASTPATASSAPAPSSTSAPSIPTGEATPAADANAPTVVLVLVLVLAGFVGVGALVARRR